jgi:hypothetical protein
MSWTNDRERYEAIAKEIEPAARLVTKDHWLWSALWWAGAILTFGLLALGMNRRRFLDEYATTIGPIQGYPKAWSRLSRRLFVHECRHTTHCVWLGWLVPIAGWFFGRHVRAWCGLPIYGVLYLALLPAVLSLRFWIELDCDRTSWKWMLRNGYSATQVMDRARVFGATVCSGRYFWPWLFWGRKIFERTARRIVNKTVAAGVIE